MAGAKGARAGPGEAGDEGRKELPDNTDLLSHSSDAGCYSAKS